MATRLTTILVIVIVGATFIAGLIVGAQRDDASGPVDLIIVNGEVYPGGGAALQEAVAVRGNQILRVGSNREVKRLRRAQTVVLDAHGATVLPGLNDSHVQLMIGALALEHLNLSSATTIDAIGSELRRYAEDQPARPWLLGRNGVADILGTAHVPARKILDEAVPDRPVLITSADGRVAWANSKALELAGIDRQTRNPRSGIVVRDRRTGEPTGVLKNDAIAIVTRKLPQPTRAEKVTALRAAISEAHKVGITSLQSVSTTGEELELLDEIRQQGDLSVRIHGSIAVPPTVTEAAVLELNKLRREYPDDPALKLGGVVVICPCDAPQLERAVMLLDKHEWTVMVRTVTGADVQAAVGAFEYAADANSAAHRERRHRVDNSMLIDGQARTLSSSGWPTAPLDPRETLDEGVAEPGELRNAIDAYTSHAAYASRDEQRKGTLARGMLADIIILSNDIFAAQPNALRETAVTVTIFDGKIVYQRPATATSND
ncbi:MAG TPA: amidohydrolase family protein [Vicinamibacterales bacterium]|nr:amidohydrolase family protein [Vicinamibacterales bacterium]